MIMTWIRILSLINTKILNIDITYCLTNQLQGEKSQLEKNLEKDAIPFYTGFPNKQVFEDVLEYLNPGENGENIILMCIIKLSIQMSIQPQRLVDLEN